jgi:hypothetical protein
MAESTKPTKKDEKKSLSRAKVETQVAKRNDRIMTPARVKFLKQAGVLK